MSWRRTALFKPLVDEITRISGQDPYPTSGFAGRCLAGISGAYSAAVRIRSFLYGKGILRSRQLPCPVISIGNIVAGGAGKTPTAVYLAGILKELGYRPVVVSRGYKGNLKQEAAVVGDGRKVFLDADTAGDEPHMMAAAGQFPVVVGKKRYLAGRLALDQLDVDVIILDDGFQHRALDRDLDLLLFDYRRPLGNGRMLPAGRLRETLGLCRKRAHGLIFTRCPSPEHAQAHQMPGAVSSIMDGLPAFYTRHTPYLAQVCRRDGQPEKHVLKDLIGDRAVLFSGIAHNSGFRETVEQLGIKVVRHLEFPDHYRYKRSDFKQIQHLAKETCADWIITTEKDWVKTDSTFEWRTDLAVIGIKLTFDDADAFTRFIESRMKIITADKKYR